MPTDTTITRYQPTILEEMDRDGGWLQVPACVPFPAGEFVRYEDHAAALTAAHAALAECYRLTGADPDGNEDWRLAPYAVAEVKRLREESDAEIAAAHAARDAAERRNEQLVTMARTSIDAGERIIATIRAERDAALRERDEARAARTCATCALWQPAGTRHLCDRFGHFMAADDGCVKGWEAKP